MNRSLHKLPFIFIEIQQPGDRGDFLIDVLDGETRTKITQNWLREEHGYLEYRHAMRLIETNLSQTDEQEPETDERLKHRHEDMVRYGQMLYQDLFGRDDSFKQYLSKQPHLKNGAQLILRLHHTASELWNIPWEYIHDGTQFLGIQPQFPIIRSLRDTRLERRNVDLKSIPCIRILMVISNPKDGLPLNIDTEMAMIKRAVKSAEDEGRIEIDFVEEGTLENLEKALRSGEYHILHYSGHGGISQHGSFLAMETPEGYTRPVFLHQLLPIIQESSSLRFVFLSACKAGTIAAAQASSGIAVGLLQAVPAVLSMQFSIFDARANILAESFYGSLGQGHTLEEAIHFSRSAMHNADAKWGDWGVPALYTHNPNIRLLDTRTPVPVTKRQRFDLSELTHTDPFVGRHEQRRTIRAAIPNTDIHSIYIWGMAGIGKSALVRQAIERFHNDDLVNDVLVLRCDKLELGQIVGRINQWIGKHFPKTEAILNDNTISPVDRLKQIQPLVRGKRLILVLDGIERVMQLQEDRHGEFPHPLLTGYFAALAANEWSLLTIFTSRLRWLQQMEFANEHNLEIHLGIMMPYEFGHLLTNLAYLKGDDPKKHSDFFRHVGGHPLTLQYINEYLSKNPQFNPLTDQQLPLRLSAWWHKSFLADVFGLLKPEERSAIKLLSVHGQPFSPEFVKLLVNLPTMEAAEQIIVNWELLSLADFLFTDEDDNPWYIVPNLVQTYVVSQLKPDKLKLSHAEVARVTQHVMAKQLHQHLKQPESPEAYSPAEFRSVLKYVDSVVKGENFEYTEHILRRALTWHQHLREADQQDKANEVALMLLPLLRIIRAHENVRELAKTLLEKAPRKTETHLMARLWDATCFMDDGANSHTLVLLQALEKQVAEGNFSAVLPLVLERQGEAYRNLGNHKVANTMWRTALELYRRAERNIDVARMLFYIGENAHFREDKLEAGHCIQTALQLLGKADQRQVDFRVVAMLLLYHGHIARKNKNDIQAIEYYNDTLGLGKRLGDNYFIAKGLEGLGYTYGLLGQYSVAVMYLQNAIEGYEIIQDRASEVIAQTRLAQLYFYMGKPTEAVIFCERALQLATRHAPNAIEQTEDLLNQFKTKSKQQRQRN